MPHTDDFHRAELIDRVCECARWRLGDDAAAASAAFIRRYYAHVFTDDIDSPAAPTRCSAPPSPTGGWASGAASARPIVRVYNPRLDEHGWRSEHTVVEVVTDDMPFLVDSVTAELNRRDLTVHLVVHPILRVRRDPSGRLLAAAGAGRAARRRLGRVVHARRGHPPGRTRPWPTSPPASTAVLADVRAAVGDWFAMRAKLDEVIDGFDQPRPGGRRGRAEEAGAFLRLAARQQLHLPRLPRLRLPADRRRPDRPRSSPAPASACCAILRHPGLRRPARRRAAAAGGRRLPRSRRAARRSPSRTAGRRCIGRC